MVEAEKRELADLIRAQLELKGKMPFSEFMEIALYHPRYGYYSSSAERTGPGGDYYTSPHVHPVFGKLICRQLLQMWQILGSPSPFTILEMGAGKGLRCGKNRGPSSRNSRRKGK